jgi:hypothetical protein
LQLSAGNLLQRIQRQSKKLGSLMALHRTGQVILHLLRFKEKVASLKVSVLLTKVSVGSIY